MSPFQIEVVSDDTAGRERLERAAREYCNWGRWGDDDQAGTVNFITAEQVKAAAAGIQRGQVFSLSIDFGEEGPQTGGLGRFNPKRFLLRDGDDTFSRSLTNLPRGIGGADDIIMLATHGATHWDALAHVHYDSKMWNGYDCREVNSLFGAERNDITNYRDRIVGRAVLLDLPRFLGKQWCEPGEVITGDQLDACAAAQGVQIGRGDIVLVRFGHIAKCRAEGSWGDFAGGDAPGLSFETAGWIFHKEIAAIAADTWGVEVRPNEFQYAYQPWHRVVIPQIGLLVGEMFDLDALADDCASDGRYDMFFCGNPLPVVGSVGGPINPTVIK